MSESLFIKAQTDYARVVATVRVKCKRITHEFETGLITLAEVDRQLHALDDWAYETAPEAEPDGDITYHVASTRDHIQDYAKKNSTKTK